MKKSIRIIAVAMVALLLCLTLASCGKKLSGTYYTGDMNLTKTYTTYEFSGSKVNVDSYALGNKVEAVSFEGKYSIKDGEITFTWKDAEGEEHSDVKSFKELEDGSLEIGLVTYKKLDK